MIKVMERKTSLEGIATEIVDNGVKTYEVVLDGKDPKVVAESTFKRNYKKLEVIEDNEVAVDEEVIEENIDNKNNGGNEKMENNSIVIEEVETMDIPVEVIENPIEKNDVVKMIEEQNKVVEITLSEEDEEKANEIADQLVAIVNAFNGVHEIVIEKNTKKCRMIITDTPFAIDVDCKLRLIEAISKIVDEKTDDTIAVKFDNKFKKSNPAAFKAKGLKVTNKETNEVHEFGTRNEAMKWIEEKFENGELVIKPTYYKVKKALEGNNNEYMGYIWQEIFNEETTEEVK